MASARRERESRVVIQVPACSGHANAQQDQVCDWIASSAQYAVMLRRLQRSQLQNVLIRHKAQQFVALRELRRSAQLSLQAQAASLSAPGGQAVSPAAPPPPLDSNVEALVEKLAEIAEILPSAFDGGQGLRQPRQRAFGGGDKPNEPQNAMVVLPPRLYVKNVIDGRNNRAGSRGLIDENKVHDELDTAAHRAEDSNRLDGKEINTAEGGSHDPNASLNQDYVGLTEDDDDVFVQQLRELDSNMNTMFQDLETNATKDGSKDSELFKKTGAQEKYPKEEDAVKKRVEEDRQKERAALLAQLEGLSGGGLTRRPKWRWVAEGVDDPLPDRVLKGKQLWKAAALLIIVFFIRPRRMLMQRKARSKDRDTQDWNATLTIYFDRCQTWLLKTARVPVGNSVLKSSTLNFRLNRLDGKKEAYGGAVAQGGVKVRRGFVSTLVGKVARGMSHESLVLTLMRLKVHAKGVLNGLTQEMPPSDIMTFFSYLAADGNYFPEGFFFEEETKVLSFDELGAVRNLTPDTEPPDSFEDTLYALHNSTELEKELEADNQRHHEGFLDAHHLGWLVDAGHSLLEGTKAGIAGHTTATAVARPTDLRAAVLHGRKRLPGKLKPLYRHESSSEWFDTSFVEMILTNYLMVRVLIPWILLYPRESGLVPSNGVKPSLLAHNCQVLASTVYLIVRVLRPELTPPNADTMQAAMAEETERATKISAAGDDDGDQDSHESNASDDDGSQARSVEGDSNEKEGGTKKKKLAALRRGSRVAVVRPRTVPEIMQQKRYVSVSDRQLVPGLLPDVYLLPFAEQLRPWVLQLAAEFDSWMQNVVAEVMGKVERSMIRAERAAPKDLAD